MRVSNTAIGVGLILFAVAVLFNTRTFPSLENGYPGPALFPNVLAVLFIAAGITLAFKGIRRGERFFRFDVSNITHNGLINILLVLGAIVFYILLSDFLGFLITSFTVLLILMKRLNVSTVWSLTMSAAVTLAIYGLFAKILLVALPWGLWGW